MNKGLITDELTPLEIIWLWCDDEKDLLERYADKTKMSIVAHIEDFEARYPGWPDKRRKTYLKSELDRHEKRLIFLRCEHIDAMRHDEIVLGRWKLEEIIKVKEEQQKVLDALNSVVNKNLYQNMKDKDNITDEMVQRAKDYPFRDLLQEYGWPGGKSNMFVCQFHGDRGPSFHVRQRDNRAHCFGCGWKDDKYADTIDFVMQIEGIEWKEAVRRLQ